MNEMILLLRKKLRDLLILDDAADEQVVTDGIRQGVEFRGAKLWILVLAVFVASLGLNTNSAAVIIGAMLISPLMGPIIGMGLGAAIYDFDLLRRSFRSYLIATAFSIITATLYFLVSPFSEAQSELLARTSPTIYDVLIALCGGLAGIIALGSKSQRSGNVIPGVAIATALMPPLCTVGFGFSIGNLQYAAGALYLFVINTIFIALATFIGASFIMRFKKMSELTDTGRRRSRRIITLLTIFTIVPSVILTIDMVRENKFKRHVNEFLQTEMHWSKTQIVTHKEDFKEKTITVVLIGEEIDSLKISSIEQRMPQYGLGGTKLTVMQSANGMNEEELLSMFNATNTVHHQDEALIASQRERIDNLERALKKYQDSGKTSETLLAESKLLWPSITSLSYGHGARAIVADSTQSAHEEVLLVVESKTPLNANEEERLTKWLSTRAGSDNIRVILRIVK